VNRRNITSPKTTGASRQLFRVLLTWVLESDALTDVSI
jgi:hypothetical protein